VARVDYEGHSTARCDEYGRQFLEDIDELRSLIPFADREPTYWKPPFKTYLYQSLEEQLRAARSHIDTICWAVRMLAAQAMSFSAEGTSSIITTPSSYCTSWAPIVSDGTFRPLFINLRREGMRLLASIEDLLPSVIDDKQAADEGAHTFHQQLHDNFFMIRVIWSIGKRVQSLLDLLRRTSLHSGADVGSSADSIMDTFSHATRRPLWDKVVNEHIEMMSVTHTFCPADFASSGRATSVHATSTDKFASIVERLQRETMQRRGPLPHVDEPCRVHLVAMEVKSLLLELQRMQLSLVGY